MNIKGVASYKNYGSKESICAIMKIPKSSIEYTPGETKPILMQTNDAAELGGGVVTLSNGYQTVLLPEYILGTIDYKDRVITGFTHNPNYSDIHDYQNDGLVFPEETIYDCIEKKGLKPNIISQEEIQDIMRKENNLYQKKQRDIQEVKRYAKKHMTYDKFFSGLQKIKAFLLGKEEKENGNDR